MLFSDPFLLVLALLACMGGGVLKGAIGAGAPLLAVPLLASLVDVQFAVVAFAVPNLFTNLWQIRSLWKHLLPWRFLVLFAGGGGIGAAVGTYGLKELPSDLLSLFMAAIIVLYIAFRFVNNTWALKTKSAYRLAGPAGFVGGVMQGAAGLSAPATVTFLNAMRLERLPFAASISVYFFIMSIAQLQQMQAHDLITRERLIFGLAATVAVLAGMPIGNRLAMRLSRQFFDRLILTVLAVIALRILVQASGLL